jgi:hypothetical protein
MADPTELGERALTAAQGLFKKGQDMAKRETRVLKLQTQMSRLRSQRQRLLHQMGLKVFDLFERDLVKNQELRMLCQQIRGIDADVELRREEITQIRRAESRGEGGIDAEPSALAEAEILDEPPSSGI